MDIEQIKNALNDADPQQRMKGIRELRNYDPILATPLLLNHVQDQEFLVRSFVAMGLGRKQSDAAFEALLTMMKQDQDQLAVRQGESSQPPPPQPGARASSCSSF